MQDYLLTVRYDNLGAVNPKEKVPQYGPPSPDYDRCLANDIRPANMRIAPTPS